MHGIIAIVIPAWSIPQSVPPRLVSARAEARISGSVNVVREETFYTRTGNWFAWCCTVIFLILLVIAFFRDSALDKKHAEFRTANL